MGRLRKKYLAPGMKIIWPKELPIKIWVRPEWAGNSITGELIGFLGYELGLFREHIVHIYFPIEVREQMSPAMATAVYADFKFVSIYFDDCKMIDDC